MHPDDKKKTCLVHENEFIVTKSCHLGSKMQESDWLTNYSMSKSEKLWRSTLMTCLSNLSELKTIWNT